MRFDCLPFINPFKTEKVKMISYAVFRNFQKDIAVGRFPGFDPLYLWQELHVDEDECEKLVEMIMTERKLLEKDLPQCHLFHQKSKKFTYNRTWTSSALCTLS